MEQRQEHEHVVKRCQYCQSPDIEQDETTILTDFFKSTPGIQILCNECQAEYVIYTSGALYRVVDKPLQHPYSVRESAFTLHIGLQKLKKEQLAKA